MFHALFAVPNSWINRQSITELFKDKGVSPRFLTSVKELMEESERAESLVLFADTLFSPDLFASLPLIRKKNSRLKIVLQSETITDEERRALRGLGIDDFMLRPAHPSLFLKKTLAMMPFKIVPNRLRQNVVRGFPVEFIKRDSIFKRGTKPTLLSRLSADLESFRQAWIAHYRGMAPKLETLKYDLKDYELAAQVIEDTLVPEPMWGWDQLRKVFNKEQLPLKNITDMLEQILKSSCTHLGAERVVIVSFKPHSLWPQDECPVQVYPLASSDLQIPWKSKALPTVHFPLLPLVFIKRKPLYLPGSTPLVVGGLRRHGDWLCQGKVEAASAVLPVFQGSAVVAAALVQYASIEQAKVKELAKFNGLIRDFAPLFASIDFLGRVYREIS